MFLFFSVPSSCKKCLIMVLFFLFRKLWRIFENNNVFPVFGVKELVFNRFLFCYRVSIDVLKKNKRKKFKFKTFLNGFRN